MTSVNEARIHRETARLLDAGVAGRVFPGAAACVAFRHRRSWTYVECAAGALEPAGAKVAASTIYDLASVTKSFVAVTALRMREGRSLDLSARADKELSDLRGHVAEGATLENLLSHRAGLDAWGGLYLDVPPELGASAARRWMLGEAGRRTHEEPRGSCVYSDLGYMLAGEMVARAYGGSLADAVRTHVTQPLEIAHDVRYVGALPAHERSAIARKAAPTERCEWRGKVVRGEVHDENCAALGGVSGHAGLFGTAGAVARFGTALLDVHGGRSQFLPESALQFALEARPGGDRYRMGFDTKLGDDSAMGKRSAAQTFGHLGFTGTSYLCEPKRQVVMVLLSNRVHPSRANEKIRAFRPAFHDGVLAAFDG